MASRRSIVLSASVERLGCVSVSLFFRLNGSDLRVPIDDAFDLVTSVADGSLREVPEIAERLRPWVPNIAGKG